MNYNRQETLYIGMNDDGMHAIPGSSEHIYICESTSGIFLPVISKLSSLFMSAELSPSDTPYNVSIFLTSKSRTKHKQGDKETPYDMVTFLLKNFRRASRPLRVTMYLIPKAILNQNWDHCNLWSLEHTHNKNNTENFITFQYPQEGMLCELSNAEECFAVAESYASDHGYKIRTIDYSMKCSDMADLLLKTKLHISYVGATYYLAGLTRTPTLGIGHKPHTKYGNHFSPHFVSTQNMIRFNNKFELSNGPIDYAIDTIDPEEVTSIIDMLIERDTHDFFQ
jgi:hypothetical protein